MNIPTINLARTGTNIVMLRKAIALAALLHVRIDDILITDHSVA